MKIHSFAVLCQIKPLSMEYFCHVSRNLLTLGPHQQLILFSSVSETVTKNKGTKQIDLLLLPPIARKKVGQLLITFPP